MRRDNYQANICLKYQIWRARCCHGNLRFCVNTWWMERNRHVALQKRDIKFGIISFKGGERLETCRIVWEVYLQYSRICSIHFKSQYFRKFTASSALSLLWLYDMTTAKYIVDKQYFAICEFTRWVWERCPALQQPTVCSRTIYIIIVCDTCGWVHYIIPIILNL